jgi:flagella basal body P-ring formation protein FlgA
VSEGELVPAKTPSQPVAEAPGTPIAAPDTQVTQAPTTQVTAAPTTQPEYFEDQLIVTRSLSNGQSLARSDVATQRVRVVAPGATQATLTIEDVIGQAAARDLRAGETLTSNDLKAAQAIVAGQFMTVSLKIGPDQNVETVAKALNNGAPGETIEAKNEATGEVYNIKITGPNAGAVISPDSTSNDHGVASTDNGAN